MKSSVLFCVRGRRGRAETPIGKSGRGARIEPGGVCLTRSTTSLTGVVKQADAQISKEAPKGCFFLVEWLGLVIEKRDVLPPERHQLVVSSARTAHVGAVVIFEQRAE